MVDSTAVVDPAAAEILEFAPPREFDDYVVIRKLGHGRNGHVYLAEDAVLARHVAIKFIAGAADPAARERFIIEARAVARVQHPNVLSVFRVGEVDDRPYLVSELLRGTSLADLRLPVAPARAFAIACELARGLAAAHHRGVIHGDVKPHNAFITDDNIAKLIDFGLARFGDSEIVDGGLIGTPDYMAPELWSGQPPSRRSDVYAFGATMYQLLTGAAPYAGIAVRELAAVVGSRPPPDLCAQLGDADRPFGELVMRCLDADPSRRWSDGEALRDALERLAPMRAGRGRADGNPYRGLRTFEANHRGVFFGREQEIGAVVDRLRSEPVIIVTGDSGVGKSSLVRAGVLPAITDERALDAQTGWRSATMVPGHRPLAALATALGDRTLADRVLADPEELPRHMRRAVGSGGLVLFVDQLEELVTVGDPDEVAALAAGLARLSEGISRIRLIASVRADFLSRMAALPRLGRDLARMLHFVSPLAPERIRDVIVGPAAATGVAFESDDMIDDLVAATAAAGSGGLPLLSFALAELWEVRDHARNVITRAAYDAVGGVAGALARHADAVIVGLPAPHRREARRLLVRLVTREGTRVRRTERELATGQTSSDVLAALVKGRLLVLAKANPGDRDSEATYELAHEVLVHGWATLREWLVEDSELQARHERLATAAHDWERAGRSRELTLRGSQLADVLELDREGLTELERAFITASHRTTQRRRWITRAMLVAVLAIVIAALAIQRWLAAERVAATVDRELAAAAALHWQGHHAAVLARVIASTAFARFDGGDSVGGEALWSQGLAHRSAAELVLRNASSALETALARDASRDDVRGELANVLFERAQLAELAADRDRRDELLARLAAHDVDGSRRQQWSQPATVTIHAPTDATVIIIQGDHQQQVGSESQHRLAPGSYLVAASGPGRAPVRLPIELVRGEQRELAIAMIPEQAIAPGFVYVPPGEFVFGSFADEESRTSFFQTVPAHRRTTAAFAIARAETTIAEWLAFVAAQPASERVGLLPDLPAKLSPGLVIRGDLQPTIAFQPVDRLYQAASGAPLIYPGRDRNNQPDWLQFPITGIDARAAQRYVRWLAATGRVVGARLCSEVEWERAARGADARSYPHGDSVELDDINVDVTYGRAALGLDAVGSHHTASPFGLVDMSGNAFEWTVGEHGVGYVARGGSYYHDRKTANVTNRYVIANGALRDPTVGLRVCASIVGDRAIGPSNKR